MTKETAELEAQMEVTRERLAGTIDELVHRAQPEDDRATAQITSVKGYFVDLLHRAAAHPPTSSRWRRVVGVAVLFARAAQGHLSHERNESTHVLQTSSRSRCCTTSLLVEIDQENGERRSAGGIVIPGDGRRWHRGGWSGRAWRRPDRTRGRCRSTTGCCFDPEDKAEVEVQGETYVVMRERDIHAVAADRLGDESTGLISDPSVGEVGGPAFLDPAEAPHRERDHPRRARTARRCRSRRSPAD